MNVKVNELYSRLKSSAKKRGIPFELKRADLDDMSWPITCPVLGIKLEWNTGCVKSNSFSIDRIDNARPYRLDNVVVVSYRANWLKNNGTLEELQQIASFYTAKKAEMEYSG